MFAKGLNYWITKLFRVISFSYVQNLYESIFRASREQIGIQTAPIYSVDIRFMNLLEPYNGRQPYPEVPEDNLAINAYTAQYVIGVGAKADIFHALLMACELYKLLKYSLLVLLWLGIAQVVGDVLLNSLKSLVLPLFIDLLI